MLKSPYDIRLDASFKEAARTAVEKQVGELLTNLSGTLQGDDIDALHDMRVASRRLRAALSVFGDVFPRKYFRPFEKEVSDITDALGAVRDADVLLEFMARARAEAPESHQVGLDCFIDHVSKKRYSDRVQLIKALGSLEKSGFRRRCTAMLRDLDPPGESHSYG